MIQIAPGFLQQTEPASDQRSAPVSQPRIWGLSAREIHDAFWRSKGVQCIRRGERQRLQRSADLYLLIDGSQLVLFDISELAERLTWRHAVVTRLRLIDEAQQRYSEHVVTNGNGEVLRIERRYRPRVHGYSKVMITFSKRVASLWMNAASRRECWSRVRRSISWANVDHWRCAGKVFSDATAEHERRFLECMVEYWTSPDQAIAGLEQIEPGVWHAQGDQTPDDHTHIGPVWLGFGHAANAEPIVVGPAWTPDQRADNHRVGVLLKSISEIELSQSGGLRGDAHANNFYALMKRAFDVSVSALALVALSPVMAAVGLLVFWEGGRPLLFGHRRQGKGGRVFRCWKFRTMHRNADQLARQLARLNRCDGPQVLIPNDPRVTRIGRILRATNLDELPQFWNVLVGDMSLVGPRPSPDDENQYCPAWRDLRLSVRPGITGLWQLNRTRKQGHDFQEWIKYDIQYVQNAGFRTDLVILLKTAWMLLLRRKRSDEA